MNPHSPSKSAQTSSVTRLYVSNIPFSYRENDLLVMFKPFGTVLSAEVVFNEKGSKGFGFVTLETVEQCNAAIEKLHGTNAKGRKIEVKWASARVYQPRKPKSVPTMAVDHTAEAQATLLAAQQQALAVLLAQNAALPGLLSASLIPQQSIYGLHAAYLNPFLQTQLLQRNPFLDAQVLMHQPINGSRNSSKQLSEHPQGWPVPAAMYQQLAQRTMQLQAEQPYNFAPTNIYGNINGLNDSSQHLKGAMQNSLTPSSNVSNLETTISQDNSFSKGFPHLK